MRLLIIDADQVMRALIRLYVERDREFEVVGDADSSDVALAMLKDLQPDLVTMGDRVADLSGAECIALIRKHPGNLPILAVSSSPEGAGAEMLTAGAYAVIDRAHASAVPKALKEALNQPRLDQMQVAVDRLEREAGDALDEQKRIIGSRLDLVAALDAISVALDNPSYSETEALARIRALTEAALASNSGEEES
ncbi:MAG TPA: response regulator [Actinomycetota bacterium]|nr:response regulator [Actinomycetota bacterium]